MSAKMLVVCALILPLAGVVGLFVLQRTSGRATGEPEDVAGDPDVYQVLQATVDRAREVVSMKETMNAWVNGVHARSSETWISGTKEYLRSSAKDRPPVEVARVEDETFVKPPGSDTWVRAATDSDVFVYGHSGSEGLFSRLYHFDFGLLSGVRQLEADGDTIHLRGEIVSNPGQGDVMVELFIEPETWFLRRMELQGRRSGRDDRVVYEFFGFNEETHLPEIPH